MTFWKRKLNHKINKELIEKFEETSDINDGITEADVDWLTLAPQNNKIPKLEDAYTKSERLKHEGTILAENERYWEALKKFNEATTLTPNNEVIYDLIAQSYMQLNELMPAVSAAEKTVKLNPSWWVGHQTLGRTLLNIGEVKMALSSFKRALHLNPTDEELWEIDLKWTLELIEKKNLTEAKKSAEDSKNSKMVITELKDSSNPDQNHSTSEKSLQIFKPKSTDLNADSFNKDDMTELPDSYVLMR